MLLRLQRYPSNVVGYFAVAWNAVKYRYLAGVYSDKDLLTYRPRTSDWGRDEQSGVSEVGGSSALFPSCSNITVIHSLALSQRAVGLNRHFHHRWHWIIWQDEYWICFRGYIMWIIEFSLKQIYCETWFFHIIFDILHVNIVKKKVWPLYFLQKTTTTTTLIYIRLLKT